MPDTHPTEFFVAGGTLKGNAPSYVERPADEELYQAVKRGEFCYVLTARQMGKSSLMARTARRLQAEGIETAIIDLTQIGTVAPDQWYFDFVSEVAAELDLDIDIEAWWQANASQGIVRRFTNFLRDVVLAERGGNIVIFVDEIDFTLSLDFADDFFAAIRAVYNNRSRDATFERLTFVLMGVAAPSDLVRDQTRTPFNIGLRVALNDFRWREMLDLESGIESVYPLQGKAILARIYHWTRGHPYLTQKLCKAVVEIQATHWSDEQTDQLVSHLFLRKEASKEDNLEFVRRNILNQPVQRQLLNTYRQVYVGKQIVDNERSPIINQLKLAGLVKSENGHLKDRNEIYRHVFNEAWVKANTAIDRTRVVAVTLAVILILVLAYVGHSLWQAEQVNNAALAFFAAQTDEERRKQLYIVLNPPGLFSDNPTMFRGQELFHSLTPEQQVALFHGATDRPEMMEILVKGLYETLADTDNRDSSWPILNAMRDALPPSSPYQREIHAWLKGRALWRAGSSDDALTHYDNAIEVNANNAAILFERARVLVALERYPEAARDLDRVMGIAASRQVPTPMANTSYTVTIGPSPTISTGTSLSTSKSITLTPILTEEIVKTTSIPIQTSAFIEMATITLTPSVTLTPASTPTPAPTFITSQFRTQGDMIAAVRQLIESNPELPINVSANDYPNLQAFILLPTITVTPITLAPTISQVELRVIDIQVLSPEQEVGCPTRIACGFTVSGSSTGLTDDMQIVVFVNPFDPSIDSWWRYLVSDIDEDGNWQQGVFVRGDRIFAGYEFAIRALILPRETVPELPRSMDQLPSDQFASSPTLSLKTISPRSPLGDPRYLGQVIISSPLNLTGGLVHNEPITLMGSAAGVPETMEIWVLVYVEENGLYYPQNSKDCPNASPASRTVDSWEAPYVSFGGTGDIQYDVVIVVVEPESEASTIFREFLTNGCRTGDFSGLTTEELRVMHEETAITLIVGD